MVARVSCVRQPKGPTAQVNVPPNTPLHQTGYRHSACLREPRAGPRFALTPAGERPIRSAAEPKEVPPLSVRALSTHRFYEDFRFRDQVSR